MINTSNIWKFSPSSQIQVQRCLSVAKFDFHNKWIQKLQLKPVASDNDSKKRSEDVTEMTEEPTITEETITDIEMAKENDLNEQDIDFVREVVDLDPLTHFNTLVDMCLKDTNMYDLLNNLSASSVEKVCNHIFDTKDLNHIFLEKFYRNFLPSFIKKGQSFDVLVKAKELHSDQFKILLSVLLNEKDFQSNILQEFVSTLDSTELTGFMNNIVENDIANDMFVHNMYTIFLAYKDCQKNENIQNYILKKLLKVSQVCSTDKNYGRFLLTFIQGQKDQTNMEVIGNILEKHRSPFKRPCLNALNSLKN